MSRSLDARLVSVVVLALLVCPLWGMSCAGPVAFAQETTAGEQQAPTDQVSNVPGDQTSTDQAVGAAAGQIVVPPPSKPSAPASTQSVAKLQQELLLRENFSFIPAKMLDPFSPVSVVTEVPGGAGSGEDEGNMPPEPKAPLTPLQKMSIGEIEKGLKAIMWGDMGRRALIEDASGKGYIVAEGTPLGDHEGIVTQIFNDHLIIQQSFWDRTDKKVVAQNSMVRLKKVGEGK